MAARAGSGGSASLADPLHAFENHYRSLVQPTANRRSDGFDEEFEKLQKEDTYQYKYNKGELNFARVHTSANRYANILPYEHTRVKLKVIGDDEGSDYINANYIKLMNNERTYIATQAPLPSTFPQFWRMIWEQHTHVIVMLTRETENDRTKCDRYWPEPSTAPHAFGTILVKCTESALLPSVPGLHKRVFRIARSGTGTPRPEMQYADEEREVIQFQFIGWPDHSVPSGTEPIRQLVRLVDEAWRAGVEEERRRRPVIVEDASSSMVSSPMVVHCSAGVGRTGAFIAIHHELRKLRKYLDLHRQRSAASSSSNPLQSAASASSARPASASASSSVQSRGLSGSGELFQVQETVRKMREARPGMVQQREQYRFIYETVREEGIAMFAAPPGQHSPRSNHGALAHHESNALAPALSAPAALAGPRAAAAFRAAAVGDPMER